MKKIRSKGGALKKILRGEILLMRANQSFRLKEKRDKAICKKIEKLPLFKNAESFFSYLSNGSEVSTDALLQKFLGVKKIFVPKVTGKQLRLHELKKFDELGKGRFGIREHRSARNALSTGDFSIIDCAFIPGIAFDLRGHRIGYGGGYFDRLLKKLHCTTIGLAYEFQIVEQLPSASYDIPVDFIVTEKRVICCNKKAHATAGSRSGGTKKLLSH